MEILATHLRAPEATGALKGDLASLLRPGRVLVGTVLEVTGATAVLKVGGQEVQAQVPPGLTSGQQLLLRSQAAETPGAIALQVVAGAGGEEPGLVRMLRSVVGLDRPIGELLSEVAKRVRAGGAAQTADGGLFARLVSHAFGPSSGADELRKMLTRGGLSYEAALADAVKNGASPEELKALLGDLKAELLAELDKRPEGPVREAIARALSALEAEQLLNVARREDGEPLHWSFPFYDGKEWTTAHLLWRKGGDNAGGGGDETQRISIGVSFSKTGPVRVDAWLRPDNLAVRVSVEREDVAERIRADAEELVTRLSSDARPVHLVVGVEPPERVEIEAHSMDIRYLREHHMVDVSG